MTIKNNVLKNIINLYGFSIAKIVFPLIILPYLTRVLSVPTYGTVAYVKTVMTYMQLVVDFGFMYSGTKDIVNCRADNNKISDETSNIFAARVLLSVFSFFLLLCLSFLLPILRENITYTLLSFFPVFLSVFLFDYLFRGLEQMQVITTRFLMMKSISTALTFVFVKNDSDILLIPILDILGSILAVLFVLVELKHLSIRIHSFKISRILEKLRTSFVYFSSDMATTAFGALNTVVIGALLSNSDVAYWSICMQLIAAVQALYTPITNGVYPEMVKTKSMKDIFRLLKIFIPIIVVGCVLVYFIAPYILLIIGGSNYLGATAVFRFLIPILLISFPGMLFGWPTLGAINKANNVTFSTIFAAVFQVFGLFLLWLINDFTLISLAIVRCLTEFILFALRLYFTWKNRKEYIYY